MSFVLNPFFACMRFLNRVIYNLLSKSFLSNVHNHYHQKVLKLVFRETLNILKRENAKFVVVGGWAVDAFRGKVTRYHRDIDIICYEIDVQRVLLSLKESGFNIIPGHRRILVKHGIRVDFTVAALVDEGFYQAGRIRHHYYEVARKWLEKDKVIPFLGMEIPVPHPEFLRVYSKYSPHKSDREYLEELVPESERSNVEYPPDSRYQVEFYREHSNVKKPYI